MPGVVQVYAIDLLGFGASEKSLMNYTIELWADLLSDFSKEFVDQPFVLVGNSIGSLVSLQAAKSRRDDGDAPQPCGVALINCAGVVTLLCLCGAVPCSCGTDRLQAYVIEQQRRRQQSNTVHG